MASEAVNEREPSLDGRCTASTYHNNEYKRNVEVIRVGLDVLVFVIEDKQVTLDEDYQIETSIRART